MPMFMRVFWLNEARAFLLLDTDLWSSRPAALSTRLDRRFSLSGLNRYIEQRANCRSGDHGECAPESNSEYSSTNGSSAH